MRNKGDWIKPKIDRFDRRIDKNTNSSTDAHWKNDKIWEVVAIFAKTIKSLANFKI